MTDLGAASDPPTRVRTRLTLSGVLQGIGFRPTVYRLAHELGLAGTVSNTTSGVIVEIEGPEETCGRFIEALPGVTPLPGRIETMDRLDIPASGSSDFQIHLSVQNERIGTPIPPDTAVCDLCLAELFEPGNHRRFYPFITCTLCGPRFTVVRTFPYDRETTSMADFEMCPRCRAEYENPADRRFHSQTNSCPDCGPRLSLVDRAGRLISSDPIGAAVEMLASGRILAVKGLGGFHLACDALKENAARLLRSRKGRAEKPFAVMARDPLTARRFCRMDDIEERLLTSPAAPIVLLPRGAAPLPHCIAPDMGTLGVMLPYTPIHHLLFGNSGAPGMRRLELLVMTSGNHSEEPIARTNEEALDHLGDIADAFLIHDREIELRADDSIYRVIAGAPTVFRRSRGIVPTGYAARCESGPPVVGAGGDLKNALAVYADGRITPGPHVGDLESPAAQEFFHSAVTTLTEYLDVKPEIAAVDPHPEYFSHEVALEKFPHIEYVYHHHAHACALAAEHGIRTRFVCAVYDGTGFGPDGTIWGGEILLSDPSDFTRAGRLAPFPLPGGEAAIRKPLRIAAGLLAVEGSIPEEYAHVFSAAAQAHLWVEAAAKGINSPWTSSAGRLFDGIAAIAGFRRPVTFEGQAAMWLEAIADHTEQGEYGPALIEEDDILTVDSYALARSVADDIAKGTSTGKIAARFHRTLARATAEALTSASEKFNAPIIGLSGGCFQNKLLVELIVALLRESGRECLLHRTVPPNDGGLAVGQVFAATSGRTRSEPGDRT